MHLAPKTEAPLAEVAPMTTADAPPAPLRSRRRFMVLGALALAKSKIALANFSRAQEFEADGIGVGISARAGFDPYGAERFLTSMGHNAQLRTPRAIDPRAPDFLSSHPATPERITNAVAAPL